MRVGIVDEQPSSTAGLAACAVRGGHVDSASCPASSAVSGRGARPALATINRGLDAESFPGPARCANAASRTVVAVRTTPSSSGIGVLVDLGDGGAGDDVMELIEQERLPGGFDLIVRIGEPGELRDGREGFRFEEPVLAGAVEGFRAGLGRQRAAVELQVELPHPDRQTGSGSAAKNSSMCAMRKRGSAGNSLMRA